MTRARVVWRPTAVLLLAVASLSCVLSPPRVSAAAGAEVAGGVARRNTERIAGDSLLVLSGAPDFLVVAAIFLSFILMD